MAATRAIELKTAIPGPRSSAFVARTKRAVADPLALYLPIVIEEGHGALVTDVHVGDRVTAEGHIVDGRCLLCRTGNSHVCPHTKIIGVDRDGCFADYIAMPATNVWHLADNVPFAVGFGTGKYTPAAFLFATNSSTICPTRGSVKVTGGTAR